MANSSFSYYRELRRSQAKIEEQRAELEELRNEMKNLNDNYESQIS